ncbi:c-type cytochrome [Ramlibacter albus]|uniref:C-type cytochrome n=1 Tax=Ramlibacter albus TaxID=2079448 RepID=A0A923M8T9_9BURK|nr:c-type cytochrome [Ramlibacter albus]MBC5765796.1 c-type cytochrome [Ramlibacter albus]
MSIWRNATLALLAIAATAPAIAQRFPGIGRPATPAEVAAWDIDVRPDFKGLPKGQGSVSQGEKIWETKCASCHGVFGESNEVFNPLVGGTTDDDVRTGRVATLKRNDYPGRTTLMKVAYVSTLWDYINRAMPWNAPKSLTTNEVYAVTAYMLNLARIVPDDFVISDANIAEVQKRMPNRNGMNTSHAMWPGDEFAKGVKPDVKAAACMANCAAETKVASSLPDHARNAHGNLAEQNRLVGPQRGVATTTPPKPAVVAQGTMPGDLLQRNTCTACHAMDRQLVGPSWADVARKHAGKPDYIAAKIRSGGAGVWGNVPMPPQEQLSAQDTARIAEWLATGAGR